jgi:FkbM family methyltransferase
MIKKFNYKHKISLDSILTKLAIVQFEKNLKKNKTINNRLWASFNSDFIGIHLNAYPYYEYIELETCFSFLNEFNFDFHKGVAIDIGANIGNHSLYFSEKFSQVYAFEINTQTYELLNFNTKNTNITTVNLGLSDVNSVVKFQQDNLNVGHGKIVKESEDCSLMLKVGTLDSQNLQLDNLKLIKIDVEGHELNVLKGAILTLKKFKPVILFELTIEDFKDGVPNTIDFLEKNGYQIYAHLTKENIGIRRLMRVFKEFLFGSRNEVIMQVDGSDIIPNYYSMIIAVHKDFCENGPTRVDSI